MTSPRGSLLGATYLFALVAGLGCRDAPAAPTTVVQADTTRYAVMSTRELLLAVLNRLDALEGRVEQEALVVRARLDSVLVQAVGGGTGTGALAAAPQAGLNAGVGLEGSLCGQFAFQADGRLESALSLWGGGEGMLGVDAYGNGATGMVRGFATQDVKLIPAGGASLTLQICAKAAGGATGGVEFGGSAPSQVAGAGAVQRAAPAPGPAEMLLRNLLESIAADDLAAAASRLGMDGSRLDRAVDAVSGFSLADFRFGQGGAPALLSTLPLPADVANLIQHPEEILQRATAAAQFAVDRVCSQTLFTGEFAQRASQACDLRDQVPSAPELIDILDGLDGLPARVSTLDNRLSSACTRVHNELVSRSVVIPETEITKAGAVVGVFPQTAITPFSGLGTIC